MKKQIFASLLIFSTYAHGMEWLAYLSTWFPDNQISSELSNLKAEIRHFESHLKFELFEEFIQTYIPVDVSSFHPHVIYEHPFIFLQYCYYQKLHKYNFLILYDINASATLRKKCQDAQIDGYSALGAAMLAQGISPDEKHSFIQNLINHDFKPTLKDTTLARCMSWKKKKHIFMYLLQTPNTGWYGLPHDAKKYIALYLIKVFEKEAFPEKEHGCSPAFSNIPITWLAAI